MEIIAAVNDGCYTCHGHIIIVSNQLQSSVGTTAEAPEAQAMQNAGIRQPHHLGTAYVLRSSRNGAGWIDFGLRVLGSSLD